MGNGTENRFFKKYGGFIGGGVLIAAMVTIAIIGSKSSGSSDVKMRYAMDEYNERIASEAESSEANEPTVTREDIERAYAQAIGLDQVKLRYEARVAGLNDDIQKYTVQFDCELPENIGQAVLDEIARKCGKNADDNRYGEVSVELEPGERKLYVLLNTSQINTISALTGIFRALDDIQGVKSVVLNEELEGYYDE